MTKMATILAGVTALGALLLALYTIHCTGEALAVLSGVVLGAIAGVGIVCVYAVLEGGGRERG